MNGLVVQQFKDINISDPFFDTLKADYSEFEDWFIRKSENEALVLYNATNTIDGFLYLKFENEEDNASVVPALQGSKHLKVGTFKFNGHGTRLGDRYLKKIFDYAFSNRSRCNDIYVTVFSKHTYLVELFQRYGFIHHGTKTSSNGVEQVYVRSLTTYIDDIKQAYPYVIAKDKRKFMLSIYPTHHTKLFPDSILRTESSNIVQDVSHTNSIHKVYISSMRGILDLTYGDVLMIYRTAETGKSAEYSSVVTSICVVDSVCTLSDYASENDFVSDCVKFSVFTEAELRSIYRANKYRYVVKFLYNIALPKRPTRHDIITNAGIDRNTYPGFMPLSDQQFDSITSLANVDQSMIIR